MTLYELKDEYRQLLEMLEDPDIDPQVIADTMEAVSGELDVKCDSYVVIIKKLEAQVEMIDTELIRLEKNKSALTNNIKRMKSAVLDTIQMTGSRKMVTDHFKLSIVKNGGKQPMEVDEIEKIPQDYLTMKPVANMEKIRQELEGGSQLDFARLKERGEHLGIR
jgi:chaperonin cofactor prefoldin